MLACTGSAFHHPLRHSLCLAPPPRAAGPHSPTDAGRSLLLHEDSWKRSAVGTDLDQVELRLGIALGLLDGSPKHSYFGRRRRTAARPAGPAGGPVPATF